MQAFTATALLVFLRAFQQKNVIGGHYLSAAATSFAIAGAEIGVVLAVVDQGWSAVLPIGCGGALGVTAAMAIHARIFNRRGSVVK